MAERGERGAGTEATRPGNYFVANYPPFSCWNDGELPAVHARLDRPPDAAAALGLYVHVPFCRKRCDFCYFKVYTDKNSREIRVYLDAVLREVELLAARPFVAGRRPLFVYFGGGTPSYLSSDQLEHLFSGLRARLSWDGAEEVTFECEPGTLQEPKIALLRDLGVTRLSLGVENFDPDVLEVNNRAHRAKEIYSTYEFARRVGFPQINLDLIAGMVGETDLNWERCIEETLALEPDSVTVYQMEVPFNTTIYQRMQDESLEVAPVADWETKRRWVSEAFDRFQSRGYQVGSAYTVYRGERTRFLYRDELWHGADLLGVGVSSFGHVGGVHYQNEHTFDPYVQRVEAGELPLARALVMSGEERMIRQFVLQMKLGRLDVDYFRRRFGVDVLRRFAAPLAEHRAAGWLDWDERAIRTTREGLLRIDVLLHDYFLEEHQNSRYA